MRRSLIEILRNESGQVLPWMVLLITLIMGATGLTIDLGHAYVCYRQLQASTDAAALAGAYAMTASGATQASVESEVSAFSSIQNTQTNGANANGNLQNAAAQTSFKCVTDSEMVSVGCVAFNTSTTGTPNGYNVIQVTQQATVPTYFIGMLAFWSKNPPNSLRLSSVATAAMQSGPPEQVNVAIIVDTTASMGQTDTDPACGKPRITCALAGIQTMLENLTPCSAGYTGSTCTPFDRVSLFTFPAVEASQVNYDTNCSGRTPAIESYTTPAAGSSWTGTGGLSTATTTYQVTGFEYNYSSTNGKGGALPSTSSSPLVAATTTKSGCGMQTPGGAGTYYAGVIYEAQSALANESSTYANTKNIMVILSDGDAGSGTFNTRTKTDSNSCSVGTCILNSTGGAATNLGPINGKAAYPSLLDQCAQAVQAAQYATNQGTTVYTVAYGSSSGCPTDVDNVGPGGGNYNPCTAIEYMSSNWPGDTSHFYSDSNASGGGETAGYCPSAQGGDLATIFKNLTAQFTKARLVPNNIS
jgi:hypothetical protein